MKQPEKFFGAVGGDLTLECSMKAAVQQDIYWFKGKW